MTLAKEVDERILEQDAIIYPPARWRLILNNPQDGASNMALDEAILRSVAGDSVAATVRFYAWAPPCISVGYNQSIRQEIDLERCQADGVQWVRRPTGGRAILHTDELTYSIVLRLDDPRASGGVVDSYRRLSCGLVNGLRRLGLEVLQANYQQQSQSTMSSACFDVPSHYEVTVDGRKMLGSAQTRQRGVLLQHGTLPLRGDITRLVNYLRLSAEGDRAALRNKLRDRATTLEQVLGRPTGFEEVAGALAAGISEALNVTLEPREMTPEERDLARMIRAERYANPDWTEGK